MTTGADITIDKAIQRFADYLYAQRYASKTIESYTADLGYWRKWLEKNSVITLVKQLVREDLTEYLIYLSKECQGRSYLDSSNGQLERPLAATTLKKKIAAFRKFAAFLTDCGSHTHNIALGIKTPRIPHKEPSFLSELEYKALLYESWRRGKPRDYAIIVTLLQTGIREGELVRLSLDDVDLNLKKMTVKNRKGGIDTVIPLVAVAVKALSQWLAVRPKGDNQQVFISKTGKPLIERTIRYLVKYYMRKAKIKKQVSVHTLRHTFGAFKSAKNVDLKTLQYWMGHKRVETTLHYLHLIKKQAPELMEATAL